MDERLPKRKRLRLAQHDYATPGTYFVTICTYEKECVFGYVDDSVGQGLCPCRLSQLGMIVQEEIECIPVRYPDVAVDKSVVMPNHVHLLLSMRQGQSPCPTLGSVIGAFKSLSTKHANSVQEKPGRTFWQPRFYDHVVRDEGDYERIWEYIENNPVRWQDDELYVER